MSDVSPRACAEQGCSAPVARRCYFCENSFCREHITVAKGAIGETCSQREHQEREARRQEEEH